MNRCPHCDQPLPPPQIRFSDLDWLRQLAARDQLGHGEHAQGAPDHEQAEDVKIGSDSF